MKGFLRSAKQWYDDRSTYRFYSSQFKKYLVMHGYSTGKAEGEDEYVRTWSRLTHRVDPYSYRLFSHYMGPNKYILPEDVGDSVIEYYLNPMEYRAFYADKNLFGQYLKPVSALPGELLRRIGKSSVFLDGEYRISPIRPDSTAEELADAFSRYDRLVLKPAERSNSGSNVLLFHRQPQEDGTVCFVDGKGQRLDGALLRRYPYGNSFVLQEALLQHPCLARFCSTSVNTLRLCMYRSVVDESVRMFAAAVRIGHTGSVVDNLHAGGGFVKIDVETGELGHTVYDQYGGRTTVLNDIDFAETFVIPEWDKVRSFAESIVRQIHHMRLISLDVSLDAEGNPRLIEFNVSEFAFWIPMFSGQQVFGDRMEEVIEYCRKRLVRDKRI